MLERFHEITELLRHFYSLLGRLQDDPSVALKAQALVKKLMDEKLPTLEGRKKRIVEFKSHFEGLFGSFFSFLSLFHCLVEHSYEASISLINNLVPLINRAKATWEASQTC
jgi:hypothetical protein